MVHKKMWLFGGEFYYAKGGLNDLKGTADNSATLKALAEELDLKWWQIVNSSSLEVIARSKWQARGVTRDDIIPD